jgi:16S rRNA (guanine527-N7)-methyltransferase
VKSLPTSYDDQVDLCDLMSERLARGAATLGIDLSPSQEKGLIVYLALLERWNSAYNLTAVRNPLDMVSRHLLDSLVILPYLKGDSVLDLGTGAGLPGIPLAICDPQRYYYLLDGNGKKIRFVRQAVLELGLSRVEVVHGRIESYKPSRNFSTIVCRAVTSIAQIIRLGTPLLERSGSLLVMKGRFPQDELQDLSLDEFDLVVHRLFVPEIEGERHLIEIRCE